MRLSMRFFEWLTRLVMSAARKVVAVCVDATKLAASFCVEVVGGATSFVVGAGVGVAVGLRRGPARTFVEMAKAARDERPTQVPRVERAYAAGIVVGTLIGWRIRHMILIFVFHRVAGAWLAFRARRHAGKATILVVSWERPALAA